MDKNSIIGLALIALMIVGYSIYTQPSKEELEKQQKELVKTDSLKAVEEEVKATNAPFHSDAIAGDANSVVQSVNSIDSAAFGDLAPALSGNAEDIIIENEKFIAVISSKGGALKKLTLKEYQTYDSLPLMLFEEKLSMQEFVFDYPGFGRILFSDLYFEANKTAISLTGDQNGALVLSLKGRQPGQELNLIYSLSGNTYDLKFKIESKGFKGFDNFNSQPLHLNWKITGLQTEKYLPNQQRVSTIFYKYKNEDRDWLSESREDDQVLEQTTDWVAFKEDYFSAVVFSDKGFVSGNSKISVIPFDKEVLNLTKEFNASLQLPPSENGALELHYFFGPNKLEVLEKYGNDLPRIINYGWSIIGWINRNVIHYMFNWFLDIGMSIGIAIFMLTLVIKTVLAPLMLKNYKSSAKMRVLKPEVDAINKKFEGKDATQKQQAVMALYRETGVNPLSGCLPMLFQMPILYAMFRFFPSNISLRQQSFLWATDLSTYDSIYTFNFNIPLYGDHISLFTLMMSITTLIYTYMSSSNMPTASQPGMPNMKVMTYIFPVMMIFFFNNYSSGLSFYYFLSTLISITQMLVIKHYFIDEDKIHAKLQANKAKPKKKSKFQKRLEEMSKQQKARKK